MEDARTRLNVGDTIEAKIIGTDRKTHTITLSMKTKDAAPKKPKAAATTTKKKDKATDGPLKTTLGDLMKQQMSQDSEK